MTHRGERKNWFPRPKFQSSALQDSGGVNGQFLPTQSLTDAGGGEWLSNAARADGDVMTAHPDLRMSLACRRPTAERDPVGEDAQVVFGQEPGEEEPVPVFVGRLVGQRGGFLAAAVGVEGVAQRAPTGPQPVAELPRREAFQAVGQSSPTRFAGQAPRLERTSVRNSRTLIFRRRQVSNTERMAATLGPALSSPR